MLKLTAVGIPASRARRCSMRQASDCVIGRSVSNHTFRATGITAYLDNGGSLENAQAMAAHESPTLPSSTTALMTRLRLRR